MKKITQKFKRKDGTTFVAYCGDKNPYIAPLTAAEIVIDETTPYATAKEIIKELLEKVAEYEDQEQKGHGPFLDANNDEHMKIFVSEVERHGKWTKETVWIYRNDRGDIMRAQDEHPAAASEEVEEG